MNEFKNYKHMLKLDYQIENIFLRDSPCLYYLDNETYLEVEHQQNN